MRAIKFRAWVDSYDEGGVMMYQSNSLCHLVANKALPSCGNNPPQGHLDYISRSGHVLMQYTGVNDKNGIEIYEGDILRVTLFPTYDTAHVVNSCYTGVVIYLNSGYIIKSSESSSSLIGFFTVEVIGNEYKKPELLESKWY